MTTNDYKILNNMIHDYSMTHKFDSVTKLMPEIKDPLILEFIDILPKYRLAEDIIEKLKYIRDNVAELDCPTCIKKETEATEKENKTLNELQSKSDMSNHE